MNLRRQGELNQNSIDRRVRVELGHPLQEFRLGCICVEAMHLASNSGLGASLFLVADINLTRSIVANENCRELGESIRRLVKSDDLDGQSFTDCGSNRFSINQPRGHCRPFLKSQTRSLFPLIISLIQRAIVAPSARFSPQSVRILRYFSIIFAKAGRG